MSTSGKIPKKSSSTYRRRCGIVGLGVPVRLLCFAVINNDELNSKSGSPPSLLEFISVMVVIHRVNVRIVLNSSI